MAFWNTFGHQGAVGEFEWVDSSGEATSPTEGFELIKEGHLTLSTSTPLEGEAGGEGAGTREPDGATGNAAAQFLRRSNEAFIKGWKRYWCVLSKTQKGQASLLYYNKQSGFTNCEPPTGVVLLINWKKLYTLPHHVKSRFTFGIEFQYKTVLIYADNEPDLEDWLVALRKALGIKEEFKEPVSPGVPEGLKGLPKQKAMRRVCFSSTSTSTPEASGGTVLVPVKQPRGSTSTSTEIPSGEVEEEELKAAAKNVRILSYKVYPTPP